MMNNDNKKLIFVIGATATGKTHFIAHNFNQEDFVKLNVYDYQQQVYKEEGYGDSVPFAAQFGCLMRANERLLDDIVDQLQRGSDVVVEHTLFKAKRRIAYIDEIRKIPNVTIEIYVMCPSETQWKSNIRERELERTMDGILQLKEEIEFPNPAEGFDVIHEVVDGTARLHMDLPRVDILEPARLELAEEAKQIATKKDADEKRRQLNESMKVREFWHYCEVCGKREYITAKEANEAGWDYPPDMGRFKLLGPRTCGDCNMTDTLYWKVATNGGVYVGFENDLTPEEKVTMRRIQGEPESLLEPKDLM